MLLKEHKVIKIKININNLINIKYFVDRKYFVLSVLNANEIAF